MGRVVEPVPADLALGNDRLGSNELVRRLVDPDADNSRRLDAAALALIRSAVVVAELNAARIYGCSTDTALQ